MNKAELNDWLLKYPSIDWSEDCYDGCGNNWHSSYHKVGEEYYELYRMSGKPLEDYHVGKGYQKDSYTPRKVNKVTEVVEITTYVPIYDPEEKIDLDGVDLED
jgi:hypothetical protein